MRIHPSHYRRLRRTAVILAVMACGIAVVWFVPIPRARGIANYLPLHIVLETVSIVIAALVFAVSWNSRGKELPSNIILIGCAFLYVALIDFSHTLSFAGMPDYVTQSSAEKAINFWLFARAVAAVALLAGIILPWRPFASPATRYLPLTLFLVLAAATNWLLLFHPDAIPHTFVPGTGLTALKVYSEYAIAAVDVVAALILWRRMRDRLPYAAVALLGAVCAMAMSEFLFTLYADVTDIFNLLGHVYKVISYLFLYRAIFVSTVERPYRQLRAVNDELEDTQRLLLHQTLHDPLTGLPNRVLFVDRLEHALADAVRTGGRLAVYFVDLDGFKRVNDSLGHAAGDELLQAVAARLSEVVRPGDTVARFAGDEFLVLTVGTNGAEPVVRAIADRLLGTLLDPPLEVDGNSLTASIGVAVSRDGIAPEQLLREADAAMYQAKRAGRGRWEMLDSD